MSDESEPPALRLRPRKKPPSEAPASLPDDFPTPPPAPPAAEDASKIRAKPRLSLKSESESEGALSGPAESAATPEPLQTPFPAPPPPPPPPPPPEAQVDAGAARPKPRLSLKPVGAEVDSPPPEAPSDFPPPPPPPPPPPGVTASMPPIDLPLAKPEKPKLKLSWASKPEEDEAPPPPTAFPPPPPPPVAPKPISMSRPPMLLPDVTPIESSFDEAASTMPSFMPMDGGASTPPPMPPPMSMPLPPGAPDYPVPDSGVAPLAGDSAPAGKSAKKSKRKRPDQSPVFKVLVLAVFVFVIGGLSFGAYILYGMFMGGDAPLVAAPVASAPTPAPASAPSSTAGQLVEQARQAAAAHDDLTDGSDEVVEAVEEVAAPVDVPARVVIEDTAGPVVPTVAQPSAEFMAWVSQARISGVREGSNPKAFINSILVQKGDVIDVQLGIMFDGVDAQKNLVIFKDGKGAIVGKKY